MSTGKRKASVPNPASILQEAARSTSSKRQRFNDVTLDATVPQHLANATIEDDPELEEQDRKRQQQGRKGRVITSGYESESSGDEDGATHRIKAERRANDDGEDDMFGADEAGGDKDDGDLDEHRQRKRFLQLGEIEGQEFSSKSRGKGQGSDGDGDGDDIDNDDHDPDLELEDSDEEQDELRDLNALGEQTPPTSPGGTPLRAAETSRRAKGKVGKRGRHGDGIKVTGFNMKDEMQTGKFDEDGNYVENSKDPHADHDVWLAGNYSRSKIRAAREAQKKREHELQAEEAKAQEEDNDEDDVKKRLVELMRKGESVLGTLRRLGKQAKQGKASKAQRASEQKTAMDGDGPAIDQDTNADAAAGVPAASKQAKGRPQAVVDLEDVTHLSSVLISRFGQMDAYDRTYESLLRDVRKSGLVRGTFDPAARFEQPSATMAAAAEALVTTADPLRQWEYKWSPSYLAAAARSSGSAVAPDVEVFGPFPEADIKGWSDNGYFGDNGERILLRPAGSKSAWQRYTECLGSPP